jgi:predicted SnoaL-like aldol condensation-catalyzing enzyme
MKNISNKKLVLAFYMEVIGQRNSDLIDHYVSDNYTQHSPLMKDGKSGLREAIEYLKLLPKPQDQTSPVVLAIAEGDYVLLLLDLHLMGKHLCVTDLFKVIHGKISEHWDAIQEISTELSVPVFDVDTDAVLTDDDKELANKHLDLRRGKIHRIIVEGNVVGVQSEIDKSGKRCAAYDFIKIVESRIIQSWSVEQEFPDMMYHQNGIL